MGCEFGLLTILALMPEYSHLDYRPCFMSEPHREPHLPSLPPPPLVVAVFPSTWKKCCCWAWWSAKATGTLPMLAAESEPATAVLPWGQRKHSGRSLYMQQQEVGRTDSPLASSSKKSQRGVSPAHCWEMSHCCHCAASHRVRGSGAVEVSVSAVSQARGSDTESVMCPHCLSDPHPGSPIPLQVPQHSTGGKILDTPLILTESWVISCWCSVLVPAIEFKSVTIFSIAWNVYIQQLKNFFIFHHAK